MLCAYGGNAGNDETETKSRLTYAHVLKKQFYVTFSLYEAVRKQVDM